METTGTASARSLYERLGKTEGIAALVDDIAAAHVVNPTIQARFLPLLEDPERLALVKHHLATFLEAGSGGPAAYSGRSMPDTHRGMNISPAEYMGAVDDIMNTLQKHDIDEETRKDVLAIAWSLKGDIISL